MYREILPAIEKCLQSAAGAIPVVFKGLSRTYKQGEEKACSGSPSMYKLSYVKSGVVEFVFDGKNYEVRRGGSILIRPQTSYVYCLPDQSSFNRYHDPFLRIHQYDPR